MALVDNIKLALQRVGTELKTKASLVSGKVPLSQAPARQQYTITLAEAKAAATRSVITTRTDVRILVVGGTSTSDWATPWLLEPTDTFIGDAWDIAVLPNG